MAIHGIKRKREEIQLLPVQTLDQEPMTLTGQMVRLKSEATKLLLVRIDLPTEVVKTTTTEM